MDKSRKKFSPKIGSNTTAKMVAQKIRQDSKNVASRASKRVEPVREKVDKIRSKSSEELDRMSQKRDISTQNILGGIYNPQDLSYVRQTLRVFAFLLNKKTHKSDIEFKDQSKSHSKSRVFASRFSNVIDYQAASIPDLLNIRENTLRDKEETLSKSIIMKAVRDGKVVLPQKGKITLDNGEVIDGYEDKIVTEEEAYRIIFQYFEDKKKDFVEDIITALSTTMGIVGIAETVVKNSKKDEGSINVNPTLILYAVISAMNKLYEIKGISKKYDREALEESISDSSFLHKLDTATELTQVEQVNSQEFDRRIVRFDEILEENELDNYSDFYYFRGSSMVPEALNAAAVGLHIINTAEKNSDGKINGAAITKSLMETESIGLYLSQIEFGIEKALSLRGQKHDIENRKKNEIKYKLILKQAQKEENLVGLDSTTEGFYLVGKDDSNFHAGFIKRKRYSADRKVIGKPVYSAEIFAEDEFRVQNGDVVLITGTKGAGKTTFVNFLKRGNSAYRNSIKTLEGKSADHLGNQVASFNIKMLQEAYRAKNLFSWITGADEYESLSEEDKEKLMEMLKMLGLDKIGDSDLDVVNQLKTRELSSFSNGEQVCLTLIKFFMQVDKENSIIIIDEPTSNLDTETSKKVFEMLKKYVDTNSKEKNTMMIIVSHDDEAKKYANKHYDFYHPKNSNSRSRYNIRNVRKKDKLVEENETTR